MPKIYYGIKATPKGKARADMEQSAKHDQVRRYGLYKIDPALVPHAVYNTGFTHGQEKARMEHEYARKVQLAAVHAEQKAERALEEEYKAKARAEAKAVSEFNKAKKNFGKVVGEINLKHNIGKSAKVSAAQRAKIVRAFTLNPDIIAAAKARKNRLYGQTSARRAITAQLPGAIAKQNKRHTQRGETRANKAALTRELNRVLKPIY